MAFATDCDDSLHEECGVFGIFGHPDAAAITALAPDGVGRIGILFVDVTEQDPRVDLLLKPERFRSSSQITDIADQYMAANQANWEVRE